jgi:hypothetical protein
MRTHDRLKLKKDQAVSRLDKVGRWFWGATRYVLANLAKFDDQHYAFSLASAPISTVPTGRYQLLRGAVQPDMLVHAYRLTHPLGEWTLDQAMQADTPLAELVFDHSHHPTRISALEPLRGKSGWLRLIRLQVNAFDTTERLLMIARSDDEQILDQELCEKLLLIEAASKPKLIQSQIPQWLDSNSQRRVDAEVALILDANQKLFADERDKLDKWADDKIFAAETELTDIKTRIAANKREARKAETTEQQVALQNSLRELERQQRQKRQAIFEVEDQISEQRDALIADLQKRLTQDIQNDTVFTIRWCVV